MNLVLVERSRKRRFPRAAQDRSRVRSSLRRATRVRSRSRRVVCGGARAAPVGGRLRVPRVFDSRLSRTRVRRAEPTLGAHCPRGPAELTVRRRQ